MYDYGEIVLFGEEFKVNRYNVELINTCLIKCAVTKEPLVHEMSKDIEKIYDFINSSIKVNEQPFIVDLTVYSNIEATADTIVGVYVSVNTISELWDNIIRSNSS